MNDALPTIHLNGTSREALLEQACTAARAIRAAIVATIAAAPNARDYYPQGNDAIGRALARHRQRLEVLGELQSDFEELAEHIDSR